MKPKFLKNPKTDTYKNFKNLVLSADFSWFRMAHTAFEDHQEGHEDFPFLSHRFLTRPLNSCLYSKVNSSHVDEMQRVFREITFDIRTFRIITKKYYLFGFKCDFRKSNYRYHNQILFL